VISVAEYLDAVRFLMGVPTGFVRGRAPQTSLLVGWQPLILLLGLTTLSCHLAGTFIGRSVKKHFSSTGALTGVPDIRVPHTQHPFTCCWHGSPWPAGPGRTLTLAGLRLCIFADPRIGQMRISTDD